MGYVSYKTENLQEHLEGKGCPITKKKKKNKKQKQKQKQNKKIKKKKKEKKKKEKKVQLSSLLINIIILPPDREINELKNKGIFRKKILAESIKIFIQNKKSVLLDQRPIN